MDGRDIVVVGASAGGVDALRELVASLPGALSASVFVVLHLAPDQPDILARLLTLRGKMPAKYPLDREPIERGQIYVAPANNNMLLERGRVRVQASPKEYLHRPAINALFRSAAMAYGRRVIGIVLTGRLSDGTAGLWEIKKCGGIAIVQDPDEAPYPDMPRAAVQQVEIDYCLPLARIAVVLTELTRRQPAEPRPAKIVIVEDERIVARNLEKRLRAFGYQVTGSVSSGEEAIDVSAKTQPDVVLMDIQLTGTIDGTEAAKILWDRFHTPVVYMTAHTDSDTIQRVKGTIPYGYLVKPFRPDEIHAAIQLALDRRDKEEGAI